LDSVDAIKKSIWLIASITASFVATFHQTPFGKETSKEQPQGADNFLTRQVWEGMAGV